MSENDDDFSKTGSIAWKFGSEAEAADAMYRMERQKAMEIASKEAERRAFLDAAAFAALQGIGTWMPSGFANLRSDEALSARAEWAYRQANAMLKARA